jgi:polysaccharide biosynthesis/export protein
MSVDDYLNLAGGSMQSADNSSIFVIMPDGTARPASSNFFDFFANDPIPPGSTIVVPPDPAPFNTMVFLQNLAQIVSQVAIAGASLAVISSNHS